MFDTFTQVPFIRYTARFIYSSQSLSSPVSHCKRHQVSLPRIILRDLAPEQVLDKDPPTPPVCDLETSSPKPNTCASPKDKGERGLSAAVIGY